MQLNLVLYNIVSVAVRSYFKTFLTYILRALEEFACI